MDDNIVVLSKVWCHEIVGSNELMHQWKSSWGEFPCRMLAHQIVVDWEQTRPNVDGICGGRFRMCQLATFIFSNMGLPIKVLLLLKPVFKRSVTGPCRLKVLWWAHGNLVAYVHNYPHSWRPPKCGWLVGSLNLSTWKHLQPIII